MTDPSDKKIIEDEIQRLETAWRNAQDRYAYNGSRFTEKTMYKYDVLRNALENFLYNRDGEATRKAMIRYQDQLVRVHRMVDDSFRRGKIADTAYVEITKILMEG